MTFGRHADDELVAVDRVVRRGLGVREGQTIRDRAREVGGHVRVIGGVIMGTDIATRQQYAAVKLLHHDPADPWRGLRAAAKLLEP